MPLVLIKGIPESFKLEKADPSGDTFVMIKPATVAEQAARDDLNARATRTIRSSSPDAIEVKSEWTFSQRQALEVFLTMVDCNVMVQESDAEGKPSGDAKALFKTGRNTRGEAYLDMNRIQFTEAWGKLPTEVADEIHSKVLKKNPQWDPFATIPG
jgi:hypothetical protein